MAAVISNTTFTDSKSELMRRAHDRLTADVAESEWTTRERTDVRQNG